MSKFSKIEDAVAAIRSGQMVVVLDDEDRENEGDLIVAAEFVTPEVINFMAKEGRGLICAPIDNDIADRLALTPMVGENKESHHCNFTVSVDYLHGTTTGISASDRARTIKALADYTSVPQDFSRPGHVFPLRARTGGVLVRAGHTEAAIDLMKLAGLSPAAAICEIAGDDGEMMRGKELVDFAAKHKFSVITIKDLIHYRHQKEQLVKLVAESLLPTDFGEFLMKVYRSAVDGAEHIALIKGIFEPEDEVLLRVHSECMTSEVFHSQKCDCRVQLDKAMEMIAKEEKGAVIYMRQEGRGIGLTNKIKAYALQNAGYDTVEANQKLGLPMDLRDYGIGAQIIADLGIRKLKLMTNNPKKIVGLEGYGLKIVERIPLEISPHSHNIDYLKTKKKKMGHLLDNV